MDARRSGEMIKRKIFSRRASPLDPLDLSVMAHAFSMIAEEMGTILVRGALSPNIRERRDASSALFDARGRMIAQAAHIPVHLGAMPESVRAVMEKKPRPGDVFVLNDPYAGGSHLPDLTLVAAIGIGAPDGRLADFRPHPPADCTIVTLSPTPWAAAAN